MALLTVLWILAIFTALIATLSITATLHTRSSEAISRMGHNTDMAETALQSWMAQLRSDAIPVEDGVILTEIMQENPGGNPIRLNEFDANETCGGVSGESVEIVNLSSSSVDVSGWKINDANPSEICQFSGSVPGGGVKTCTGASGLNNTGDDVRLVTDNGKTIETYTYSSDATGSWQKQPDGSANTSDWQKSSCSPGTINSSLANYSPPDLEFVELYNTNLGNNSTDTITVTPNYKMLDQYDSTGTISSNQFNLKEHPEDTYPNNSKLAPNQVGLVLHKNISQSSLKSLGVLDEVKSNQIRLFYLESDATNNPQFFKGGLHDTKLENITLKRDGAGEIKVLNSGSWSPDTAVPRISRYKVPKLSTADNVKENWPESGKGGTPGEIPGGGDSHLDPWGWGGDLIKNIPMTSKVYLPSMKDSRQPNDYGYVEMLYIEDEAGKIDLLEDGRSDNDELIPPNGASEDRDISSSSADEVRQFADANCYGDFWYTPGTLFTNDCNDNALTTTRIDKWLRLRHVYSGLRIPQDGSDKKININTAPYTALKTLKMCNGCSPTEYLTEKLAKKIIRYRSGSLPAKENGNYKIPNENYSNGGEHTITKPQQICEQLKPINSDFNCSVFRQQIKFSSEGIFRAVIRAATLDSNGNVQTSTILEAIVDRRPIENSSGEMEILYKRKY